MRAARALTAIAAAACLTGCGGGGAAHQPPSGAALFRQDCRSCHSLIGNESAHRQGGDLLHYRMSRADLTSFTREMPVHHILSAAELSAVVDYVLRAQRAAGSGILRFSPPG